MESHEVEARPLGRHGREAVGDGVPLVHHHQLEQDGERGRQRVEVVGAVLQAAEVGVAEPGVAAVGRPGPDGTAPTVPARRTAPCRAARKNRTRTARTDTQGETMRLDGSGHTRGVSGNLVLFFRFIEAKICVFRFT